MARAKGRFELNEKGVGKRLRDPAIAEALEAEAAPIKSTATRLAGDGAEFSVKRFQGADRVRVHVATANPAAMLAEQTVRALTRAGWGR